MSLAAPVPTYEASREPGQRVAIDVQYFDATHARVRVGAHGHRDLELLYFERGGGHHAVAGRRLEAATGDVVLIAPGQVHDLGEIEGAIGWAVEFSPLDLHWMLGDAGSLLLWRANPLLNPFLAAEVDPTTSRFNVAPEQRPRWEQRMRELRSETAGGGRGQGPAIAALLVLLLVDVARLAEDVVGAMRSDEQPVLAAVFETIERRFREHLILADVADAVGLSPGHLTTVVRERTGRTVMEWVLERRLAEARSLLLSTDLTVEAIGARVGFDEPGHFSRRFRQVHACPPGAWRRAALSS